MFLLENLQKEDESFESDSPAEAAEDEGFKPVFLSRQDRELLGDTTKEAEVLQEQYQKLESADVNE